MHECPICLEYLFSKNSCTLRCGHCFHYECIKKQEISLPVNSSNEIVYSNYKCPVCRTQIEPWDGDIIMLNGMTSMELKCLNDLEFSIDLMSKFEIKNLTILNQRYKFYMSDLENVKKEIEAGNKELDNLNTLKGKVCHETENITTFFKKKMNDYIESCLKDLEKNKEEKNKVIKETKNLKKKTEEEMKKMKEKFQKEIKEMSEKEMRKVKKDRKELDKIIEEKTQNNIKEYIEKYNQVLEEKENLQIKYQQLLEKINFLVTSDNL